MRQLFSVDKIKLLPSVEDALSKTGILHLKDSSFYLLSGGEKQRVSLARCICERSDLIILDEPSSFLDKESKNSFISLLLKISESDSAVIIATHDKELITSLNFQVIEVNKWKD